MEQPRSRSFGRRLLRAIGIFILYALLFAVVILIWSAAAYALDQWLPIDRRDADAAASLLMLAILGVFAAWKDAA